MILVIYEGEFRNDRFLFFLQPAHSAEPRNPIMSAKPLMCPITLRASLSFNSFLQHIVSIGRGSVTPGGYQCPYKAEMFRRPSVLKSKRAVSLMNERRLYSYSKSAATQGERKRMTVSGLSDRPDKQVSSLNTKTAHKMIYGK